MVTNQQAKAARAAVEDAATTILAYLDMGNDEEVQRLLTGADRHGLGLIIATWYGMCVAHQGIKVTVNAAAKTMEFFNAAAKQGDRDPEEAAADEYASSLLFHLVDNAMDRYARAWQRVLAHEPDISTAVAARLLGFTRGMLMETPEKEEV